MSTMISRRAFAAIAALTAAGAILSACGKKGAPLPPRGQPSSYPGTYPAPSMYPRPGQTGGRTLQNPPPERQQPSADDAVSGEQGTNGQGQ